MRDAFRSRILRFVISSAIAVFLSACSTMSVPMLSHETGETLGTGNFKFIGHFESARLFPLVPFDSAAAAIAQGTQVFQSTLFGMRIEGGVMPFMDLQADMIASGNGGGWRLGSKVKVYTYGRWSFATMVGFGASSGAGTVTYLTADQPVNLNQTLSAQTFDLSFPVSFLVTPAITLYSGLSFLYSGVTGSAGPSGENVYTFGSDVGLQLGIKTRFGNGRFEPDLGVALMDVSDQFSGGGRWVPYVGFGFGILF